MGGGDREVRSERDGGSTETFMSGETELRQLPKSSHLDSAHELRSTIAKRAFRTRNVADLRSAGWPGLSVPEEFGGCGAPASWRRSGRTSISHAAMEAPRSQWRCTPRPLAPNQTRGAGRQRGF